MKRKLFKSLLAIACLLSSMSVSAYDYDFEVDGNYYSVVSMSNLTCSITKGDREYTGNLVIPATFNYNNRTFTVVGISGSTFANCSGLTSITIPNSISYIHSYAFNGCTNLENVIIEDGEKVLELGYNTAGSYYNNTGKGLFYDCPIKSLYIGRDLSYEWRDHEDRYYELLPFSGIETIKELTTGGFVSIIKERAFYGCSGLTHITISSSVTTIENNAFTGCPNLEDVYIEDGETVLEMGLQNDNRYFHRRLFDGSPISTLYLGRNLSYSTSWSNGFYDPAPFPLTLKNVTIGNSVTEIGKRLFLDNKNFTDITIPNSVKRIESEAFANCSNLTSVAIGNSVTYIGYSAFEGCDALTTLYSLNTVPPYAGSSSFTNSQYMNLNVYVPNEALSAYQSANVWKDFWNLQGSDFTGIETVKANKKSADKYYDIRGNRHDTPKHGLNIINGKKVIVK